MTLQQLDEVLNRWKSRLSAMAENLLELQCESTYQSLTGTGGLSKAELAGETAARFGPALGSMHALFEQYGLLQSTIDRAQTLRENLPVLFGTEAALREISQLLFTPSIEVQTRSFPLDERSLLSDARHSAKVTPEALLESMERGFAQLRDVVSEAARAWSTAAERLERTEAELAELAVQRALPSALLQADLQRAVELLDVIRAQVATDPLGATRALQEEIRHLLAGIRERVTRAERASEAIRAAQRRWQEMRSAHEQALQMAEEVREKLGLEHLACDLVAEEKMAALGEWIARLECKQQEGVEAPLHVGLRNWNAAADTCAAQDQQFLQQSRRQLGERSELRGRLGALQAKAKAFGVGQATDLETLGLRAQEMLYARPVDLQTAAELVARYERSLLKARAPAAVQPTR